MCLCGTYTETDTLQKAQDQETEMLTIFMCATLDLVSISLGFRVPICEMKDNFFHARHTALWSRI